MKLEIQAFGGIVVSEEIPSNATKSEVVSIARKALANAAAARDAYLDFIHENETDDERELREFQQEQQKEAIQSARIHRVRMKAMLGEADT